jgi:hypothetical protein
MIYPHFGSHPSEYLVFGIQSSERFERMIKEKIFYFIFYFMIIDRYR